MMPLVRLFITPLVKLFITPLVLLFMIPLVLLSSVDAKLSVVISPSNDYTTFENNASTFTFNCSGNGTILFWIVDGYTTGTSYVLNKGIQPTPFILSPDGLTVSSQLIVPTTKANNKITVICTVQDSLPNHQSSNPVKLLLQGILPKSQQFQMTFSNSSVNLSWVAPDSLQVSTPPTISYYILTNNLTHSAEIVNNPSTCNSSASCNYLLDLRESTTILDYNGTVQFSFFAVNGAGNGSPATFVWKKNPTGVVSQPNQTIPTAGNASSTPVSNNTTTTLLTIGLIAIWAAIAVVVVIVLIVAVISFQKKVFHKGVTSNDTERAVHTTDGLFNYCFSRAIGGNTSCSPEQCTAP